jgi:hypothetical protein
MHDLEQGCCLHRSDIRHTMAPLVYLHVICNGRSIGCPLSIGCLAFVSAFVSVSDYYITAPVRVCESEHCLTVERQMPRLVLFGVSLFVL